MSAVLSFQDPMFEVSEDERLSLFSRSGLLSLPLTDNEQQLLGGSLGILSNQDTKAWTYSIAGEQGVSALSDSEDLSNHSYQRFKFVQEGDSVVAKLHEKKENGSLETSKEFGEEHPLASLKTKDPGGVAALRSLIDIFDLIQDTSHLQDAATFIEVIREHPHLPYFQADPANPQEPGSQPVHNLSRNLIAMNEIEGWTLRGMNRNLQWSLENLSYYKSYHLLDPLPDESDKRNVFRLYQMENPDESNRFARQKAWICMRTQNELWSLIRWTLERLNGQAVDPDYELNVPDLSPIEVQYLVEGDVDDED